MPRRWRLKGKGNSFEHHSLIGVIYGTYHHAVHHWGAIMGGPGRIGKIVIFKFLVYATPIFMGAVLTFFMVKPLLARRINEHQPYALNPEAEPTLYELIRRICEQVGAPLPTLIELDSSTNAAASFRRGFSSFFSNDLSLHIGLSLMAGLTTRQFAGVIAHEFGHFTQGLAMRLYYIISRIEGWFARVIYERDSWDVRLEEMAEESEDGYIAIMVAFARLGVWFSRAILKILLFLGRAISCFLSRQMEFHADQFEIHLAGSQTFENTSRRLNEINILSDLAFKEVRVTWKLNKRLPDNIPQYVMNKAATELGAKVKHSVDQNLGFVKTGLFHTHPSDADRVREARLSNAPGIFHLDRPASDLFQSFSIPAKIVTQLFYQDIEIPLPMAKIYEVEPIAAPDPSDGATPIAADGASIDRFLFGVVTPLRPIFPKIKPIDDFNSALAMIQAMPSQINSVAEAIGNACAQFDQADQDLIKAASEGSDLTPAREQKAQARRSLRAILEACEERLSLALSLANVSKEQLEGLCEFGPALNEMDNARIVHQEYCQDPNDPPRVARLQESVANIEAALQQIPCPWPEGKGATLLAFLRAHGDSPMLISDWAEAIINFTMSSYMRMLGELTLAAEKYLENPKPPGKRAIRISAPAAAS